MAGLGGDDFALIRPPGGPVEALNASGPAGSKATRELYEGAGHTSEIPSRGPLAALTVPGAVDGWRLAHERHGRLPWSELFDDAIHLARAGFAVSRSLAQWLPQDAEMLGQDPGASSIYLPGGRVPRVGDRLVNPDLAGSFEVLARRGAREGFYEGELAERLCGGAPASPLVAEDFAGFSASWVEPIKATYRGLTVLEMPPNTQGLTALQMLNLLEGYDVARWGDLSVEYVHHAAEAVKLAFADRDAWLTDPEYHDIPLDRLLAKDYADERRRMIDPAAPSTSRRCPAASMAAGPAPPPRPGRRHLLPVRRGRRRDGGLVHRVHLPRLRFRGRPRGHRHRAAEPRFVLLPRRGAPQPAGAVQAHVPHPHPHPGAQRGRVPYAALGTMGGEGNHRPRSPC
jgi:gamma-glutamyltranspeptidase/glutathione hydrolase